MYIYVHVVYHHQLEVYIAFFFEWQNGTNSTEFAQM